MQTYEPRILVLPREILDAILVHAVQARFQSSPSHCEPGFSRALRLRLVCKTFDTLCRAALFKTRILDDYEPLAYDHHEISFIKQWPIRRNHGAQQLLHSYLVYRVQNESDPSIFRYVEVRQIADSICHETGADFQETVQQLCWLGLGVTLGRTWRRSKADANMSSPDASLLSAAAFLGHATVVKRLLENGNDPTHNDRIFPSAIEATALSGKIEILQLLQKSLPDNVEPTYNDTGLRTRPFVYHYSLGEIYQKGKADIQGVFGAAMNGDTGILETAIYPPSRADQSAAYFDYVPHGDDSLPKQWRPKVLLGKVAGFAKNWAVYARLISLIPELSDHVRAMHLRRFAEYGNFDVVKNLLDAGYHVDGNVKVTEGSVGNGNVATPLYLAARFGNEDVVNLLLEYGADVHKARLQIHRPIEGAVKSGSIAIVRKLLAYGAVCDYTIVVQALLSEYTAMVELLLDQFTEECLHAAFGADLAEEMSERGLSSMLDLLYNRECFRYSDGTIVPYSPIVEDGHEYPKCGELHK